ncbi:MAG: hypothetical protein WCY62_07585 [Clostridia bacterium]
MTFEEFLVFRNVKIKNSDHERIVRLFFVYLESITGNKRLLPDLIGQLLDIDLSSTTVPSGCFNGIFDGTEPPYNDVDFYMKLSNDLKIFIYGSIRDHIEKELEDNEYVVFIITDNLSGNIIRKPNRYIYLT